MGGERREGGKEVRLDAGKKMMKKTRRARLEIRVHKTLTGAYQLI